MTKRRVSWLLLLGWGLVAGAQAQTGLERRFGTAPDWSPPAPWVVADGRLTVEPGTGPATLLFPEAADLADFRAELTLEPVPGERRAARAGLLYRAADDQHGYLAMVRADGAYWLGVLEGGSIQPSLSGHLTTDPAGRPLVLTVICDGPRQIVLVNGHRLLERRDDRFRRGGVGLIAEGPGRSAFASFQLGEAADPPSLPVTPTPPVASTPVVTPTAPEPPAPGVAEPAGGSVAAPPDTPTETGTRPSGLESGPPEAPAGLPAPGTAPVEGRPGELGPVAPTGVTSPAGAGPEHPTTPVVEPAAGAGDGARVDGGAGLTEAAIVVPAGAGTMRPEAGQPGAPVAVMPPVTPRAGEAAVPGSPGSAATPLATGAVPPPGSVLFEETFGDPPMHFWRVDEARQIQNGQIAIQAREGYLLSGFPLDLGDYRYQARARALSEGGGTYGLVVRLQPGGDSGYLCVVREPDVFAVARLDTGKATLLGRGRVVLGPDWHELEVDARDSRFVFRVDGREVAGFADSTYPRGGLGLWVDDYRQAAFDDLLATALGEPGSGAEPAPRREILFEERFDPPQLNWRQDRQRMIRDGGFELHAPDALFITAGVPESRTGNYRFEADVERLEGPDRGLSGIVARLQSDSRSGYVLALRGSGEFVVLRMDRQGASLLANGPAPVRAGQNNLQIDCDSDRLTFRLNGTVVAEVRDATYLTGGFGLYADNGVVARFDNLRATREGGPR